MADGTKITKSIDFVDDPDVVLNTVKEYIDYDQMFESQLSNKLQDFYNAMNWGELNDNEFSQEFFSF